MRPTGPPLRLTPHSMCSRRGPSPALLNLLHDSFKSLNQDGNIILANIKNRLLVQIDIVVGDNVSYAFRALPVYVRETNKKGFDL
jgi:hypothetical protein